MVVTTYFFIIKTKGFSSLSHLNLVPLYHSVRLACDNCFNVLTMTKQNANITTEEKFALFLESKKLRKTPERFAIVKHVLAFPGHFTIEMLLKSIEGDTFYVSRATVYNTVSLMVEARMLRRHDIEGLPVQYEQADVPVHSHLVCTTCGKLKEVRDKYFVAFMNTRKYNAFNTSYYSHYVYGTCSTCARKIKKNLITKK